MPFNSNQYSALSKLYRDTISTHIDGVGTNLKLYYKQTIQNVNTDFDDVIREENIRKPDFAQTNSSAAPMKQENTDIITAIIKYNPKKDLQNLGIEIIKLENIIRVKSFLSDVEKLKRAEFIVPNFDEDVVFQTKYKVFRDPVPIGLGGNFFSISYWERV